MSVNKDNSPVGENCNAILCKDEEQEEWEDLGYGTDLTFGTLNVVETPHTEDDAESGTVCGILVEPCGEFGNQISAPELRDDVDLSMEKNEAISSDDGHIFVEDCGIECVWEKEPESIESVMSMKSWIACEGLRPDVTMLSNLGIGWDQATRADEMQQEVAKPEGYSQENGRTQPQLYCPDGSKMEVGTSLVGADVAFLQTQLSSSVHTVAPGDYPNQDIIVKPKEIDNTRTIKNTMSMPLLPISGESAWSNHILDSVATTPKAIQQRLQAVEGRNSEIDMDVLNMIVKDAVKEQFEWVVTKLGGASSQHQVVENRLLSLQEESKSMRESINDLKSAMLDCHKLKQEETGLEVVHKTLISVQNSLQTFVAQTTNTTARDQNQCIESSHCLLRSQGHVYPAGHSKKLDSVVEKGLPVMKAEVNNSNNIFQPPEGFHQGNTANPAELNALGDQFNPVGSSTSTTFQNTLFNDPILEYVYSEEPGSSFDLIEKQRALSTSPPPANTLNRFGHEASETSSLSLRLSGSPAESSLQHMKRSSRGSWPVGSHQHGNPAVTPDCTQEIKESTSSASSTPGKVGDVAPWLGWKPASYTPSFAEAHDNENVEERPRKNSPQPSVAKVEAKRKGSKYNGKPLRERQANCVPRMKHAHVLQNQQVECEKDKCRTTRKLTPKTVNTQVTKCSTTRTVPNCIGTVQKNKKPGPRNVNDACKGWKM